MAAQVPVVVAASAAEASPAEAGLMVEAHLAVEAVPAAVADADAMIGSVTLITSVIN